jgi:hypothetical protein
MTIRLSALRTGCALLPINIIFLHVVLICQRQSKPQGLMRTEGLGKKKSLTSSGLEPATFWLVA